MLRQCLVTVLLVIAGANGQGKEKEEFQCPSHIANGNYADPATCRRFYQCVDGYPYLNRCPSGLFFDDLQKFCTFKDEAKCGPLPTTICQLPKPSED